MEQEPIRDIDISNSGDDENNSEPIVRLSSKCCGADVMNSKEGFVCSKCVEDCEVLQEI